MTTQRIRPAAVLAALLLPACLGPGCGKQENSTREVHRAQVLMPLRVGNSWAYRRTIESAGTVVSIDTILSTILEQRRINGVDWYIDNEGYGWANRPGGLWWLNPADSGRGQLFAKYPAQPGEEFLADSSQSNSDRIRVQSTDTVITTPFGPFACHAYVSLGSYSFYAPGVGVVAGETNFTRRVRTELIDHNIK